MLFFVNSGVVFCQYVACGLSVILAHFRGEIDVLIRPVGAAAPAALSDNKLCQTNIAGGVCWGEWFGF
jgi:hypothetical protein